MNAHNIPMKRLFAFLLMIAFNHISSGADFSGSWTVFAPVNKESISNKHLKEIPTSLEGEQGQPLQGQQGKAVNNAINIAEITGFVRERAVAMLYNTVEVDRPMQMKVGTGADWWMTWYVNGEEVFTTLPGGNRYLDFNVFDHTITLPLKAGRNVVAVAVHSGSAGWRFAAAGADKLQQITDDLKENPLSAIIKEETVPPYTLPDPLDVAGEPRISNSEDWILRGRPKTIKLIEREQYGAMPGDMDSITFSTLEENIPVANSPAVYKRVQITVKRTGKQFSFPITIFTHKDKQPIKGTWIKINHRNRDFSKDPTNGFCPINTIVERGYALISYNPAALALDNAELYQTGVMQLYPELLDLPHSWRTICVWAWGVKRVVDYIAQAPELPTDRIASIGHSRSADVSLWAGINEPRIGLTVSNNGGKIRRRAVGQQIEKTNLIFPHWFNDHYNQYDRNADALPYDFHMVISCIAPRHFYLSSGALDLNADPYGQYEAMVHASKVYQLFGMQGLPKNAPRLDEPLHGEGLAYHVRDGKHAVKHLDWKLFMDYADRIWADKFTQATTSATQP